MYRCFLSFLLLFFFGVQAAAETPKTVLDTVRLYAMDCGTIMLEARAMHWFEDTDAYIKTPGIMSVPCFLIRHPHGDLLWDVGLGDKFVGQGVVDLGDSFSAKVEHTLVAQLQVLQLTAQDIEFVAFSHHHFDHTGNAALFTDASYLINRKEMEWSQHEPFGVDVKTLAFINDENTQLIERDHDLFGDGSVRILRAPGHTPGHQILMLKLANTGTVILSGDLYHTRENFHQARVAALNDSRAETLASFDRVKKFIERYNARMVVQHDRKDFSGLPKFPRYLD
ncbi:MAG TPA: N-acyl homoserine lactonase family protein [Cellvibrio sp.]|nr:N-acyl homoserine lactonase family protein [Cellvibrio sp.]